MYNASAGKARGLNGGVDWNMVSAWMNPWKMSPVVLIISPHSPAVLSPLHTGWCQSYKLSMLYKKFKQIEAGS